MDLSSLLKNFGLSDKEIAVYKALIKLGPSPVRLIAAESGINRGTTYDILKSLIDQGLASYYHKKTHQYFSVQPPEQLIKVLENKQETIEKVKAEIKETLPELKALFEREGGRPQISLYEGESGIKQILEDVLTTMETAVDKTYYVYSAAGIRTDIKEAFPDFTKKRIKKGIKVLTVALGEGGSLSGLDQRKWLTDRPVNIPTTYQLIYSGKVAHISLDDANRPVGVVIENESVYHTQKMIFESVWNFL